MSALISWLFLTLFGNKKDIVTNIKNIVTMFLALVPVAFNLAAWPKLTFWTNCQVEYLCLVMVVNDKSLQFHSGHHVHAVNGSIPADHRKDQRFHGRAAPGGSTGPGLIYLWENNGSAWFMHCYSYRS